MQVQRLLFWHLKKSVRYVLSRYCTNDGTSICLPVQSNITYGWFCNRKLLIYVLSTVLSPSISIDKQSLAPTLHYFTTQSEMAVGYKRYPWLQKVACLRDWVVTRRSQSSKCMIDNLGWVQQLTNWAEQAYELDRLWASRALCHRTAYSRFIHLGFMLCKCRFFVCVYVPLLSKGLRFTCRYKV